MLRRAADRDDDQEIDHELERERRIEAEDLRAERAAEAGEAGADRERRRRRSAPTLMPSPRATRGSSTAARSRLPKRVCVRTSCSSDDEQRRRPAMMKQPVEADLDAEDARRGPAAGRAAGSICCCEPMRVIDRRDRHEHDADREQHLVEMAALRRDAGRACAPARRPSSAATMKASGRRQQERHAAAVHQDAPSRSRRPWRRRRARG